MIDESKLITKEYLKKFGDRCKELFKENPVYSEGFNSWIKIKTSLKYDDPELGFNALFLHLDGITSGYETVNGEELLVNKSINSEIYLKTDYNKSPEFAEGINLGTDSIKAVVFAKEDSCLIVYILLYNSRNIKNLLVDAIGSFIDLEEGKSHLFYKVIDEITFESTNLPSIYTQIAINESSYPFPGNSIGKIVQQLLESTNFDIIEDDLISEGEVIGVLKKSYPEYTSFSKIKESAQSDKLSHAIEFLYDWENTVSEDSLPVNIGNLSEGEVLMLPVPDLFAEGVTTEEGVWATGVKTKNGIVVEVKTGDAINLASTTEVGGVYLSTDSTDSIGEKIPVLLDSYGRAFVDKGSFIDEKHRDDLNKSEYQENISRYLDTIWLHVGITAGNFVNGYFYKCAKTSFTVQYDTSNSPYSVGTELGTKLEKYIYDNGLTLDLTKPFRLYVDTYPTLKTVTTTSGTENVNVKISELDEFKLVNLNSQSVPIGTPLVMTKSQLSKILDITIKTTDGWDAALTKDYPRSIMDLVFTLSSSNYEWKLWDVLPRGDSESLYITNEEIDYLFET